MKNQMKIVKSQKVVLILEFIVQIVIYKNFKKKLILCSFFQTNAAEQFLVHFPNDVIFLELNHSLEQYLIVH